MRAMAMDTNLVTCLRSAPKLYLSRDLMERPCGVAECPWPEGKSHLYVAGCDSRQIVVIDKTKGRIVKKISPEGILCPQAVAFFQDSIYVTGETRMATIQTVVENHFIIKEVRTILPRTWVRGYNAMNTLEYQWKNGWTYSPTTDWFYFSPCLIAHSSVHCLTGTLAPNYNRFVKINIHT